MRQRATTVQGHTKVDFMLASQDLALALGEAKLNEEVTMATREAVDFSVKGKPEWPQVRILADTPGLPTIKPHGPVRPGTDWRMVCQTIDETTPLCQGKGKQHWQDAVDAVRCKLGQHLAEDMEERRSVPKGPLAD